MRHQHLLLVAACLLALTALPARAETYACNGDPIFARNLTGKTLTGARIRTQPCMSDSEVITVAPSGANLKILAEMDGWYKVKYGETVGWMGSALVKAGGEASAEAEKLAAKPAVVESVPSALPQVLGISEKNFTLLKSKNAGLLKRTKGKIVMRVQARGQLYFVTSSGPQLLEVKKLDELDTEDLAVAQVLKPQAGSGALKLNAENVGGKAILRWDVNGVDVAQGFKVVVSEDANPVYPGDEYHYLSDAAARSDVWPDLAAGKTYHFRVCQYLGGTCGVYSNDDSLTIAGPKQTPVVSAQAGSISLTGTAAEGQVSLAWAIAGFEPAMGFKVVKGEAANPVYPGNDYQYLSDPAVRSTVWSDLKSGKTYHFRVCQYLGGKCGVYSNDLLLSLP